MWFPKDFDLDISSEDGIFNREAPKACARCKSKQWKDLRSRKTKHSGEWQFSSSSIARMKALKRCVGPENLEKLELEREIERQWADINAGRKRDRKNLTDFQRKAEGVRLTRLYRDSGLDKLLNKKLGVGTWKIVNTRFKGLKKANSH